MESNSTAILIKIKLRHSLGRPSRSDFVQKEFVEKVSVDQITNVPINSDVFPEEYDKDGDGKVYIVGQGESVKYLDEQEYLEWKKQIFWMPEMKIESCELGEILK